MSQAIQLNDENFDSVLSNHSVALIDFWSETCAPCKALAPIIDELAEAYNGKALVGKVNADESPNVASRFKIRGLPAVVILKNGEVVKKILGVQTKQYYGEFIDQSLA